MGVNTDEWAFDIERCFLATERCIWLLFSIYVVGFGGCFTFLTTEDRRKMLKFQWTRAHASAV